MIEVSVEMVVSVRDFGVIFSATVLTEGHPDHGRRVRVRADMADVGGVPAAGERWCVDGQVEDMFYGRQVLANALRRLLPTGKLIREFLASHAPGIGQERAGRLWDAFGERLGTVLSDEGAVQEIADVVAPDRPLLAVRLAAAAVASWRNATSEAAALAWFDAHGVSNLAVARRVIRILGDDAVEKLTDNPYLLVPLLPWPVVDGIGLRVLSAGGAPPDDVRRQVGAADEAVKRALAKGDTVLSEADLRSALTRLLRADSDAAVDTAMAAAERNGAVVAGDDGYRAPGAALMEDGIVERLRTLMGRGAESPVRLPPPSRLAELVADVTPERLPLHPQQAAAVMQVLSRPVACLTGGGGTGKTHTCKVLCDAWERLGGEVLLCALAGKAALRLSRSTRRLARTLARTLGELEERERLDRLVEDRDTDADARAAALRKRDTLAGIAATTLVLVDEASMVDVPTLHGIVRRMPDGARLLLVGDQGNRFRFLSLGWVSVGRGLRGSRD
ncbi:MAG: AAA family ATPase [Methylorubrum populi]